MSPAVKLPGGGPFVPLTGPENESPRPAMFQKADGTFLDLDTFEERLKDQARRSATTNRVGVVRPGPAPLAVTQLAAVQQEEEPMTTVTRAEPEHHPGAPTQRQQQAWDAVERLGTQVAAAKELGVTQGAIQSALSGYMKRKGLAGDLPGKLSPEAKYQAIVEGAHKGGFNGAPVAIGMIRGERVIPAANHETVAPPEMITVPSGAGISAEALASLAGTASPTPPATFTHEFVPSAPELQSIDFDDFDPIVWGALYWLAEHAHNWTQEQAEKWLRGFTAALDLAYPPAA